MSEATEHELPGDEAERDDAQELRAYLLSAHAQMERATDEELDAA